MISLSVKLDSLRLPTRSLEVTQRDLDAIRLSAANEVRDLVAARLRAQGGRSWWGEAADATRRVSAGEEEIIQVEKRGVRLQWLGGLVTPKRAKLLAIPADKDTKEYPRAYSGLQFRRVKEGKYPHLRGLLVEAGKDGRLRFRLVDKTTHLPHPHVIPTREEMQQSAQHAANEYIKYFMSR